MYKCSDFQYKEPSLPYKLSATGASTFNTCERMFFWNYLMKMVSTKRSYALIGGHAGHEALAAWDMSKDINHTLQVFNDIFAPHCPDKMGVSTEKYTRVRLEDRILRYTERYSDDLYETIGTEIAFGDDGKGIPITPELTLIGRSDGRIKDPITGEILCLERKFVSELGYSFGQRFKLNLQVDLNLYAMSQIYPQEGNHRMLLDAIAVRIGDDKLIVRPRKFDCLERIILSRTDEELERGIVILTTTWERIKRCLDSNTFNQTGIASGACANYGGCQYLPLCCSLQKGSVDSVLATEYVSKVYSE